MAIILKHETGVLDLRGSVSEYLKGSYEEYEDHLISLAISGRTWCNSLKLQQGKLQLEIRKNFLALRGVKH